MVRATQAGSAYIYVDGVQQSAASLNGDFHNWDVTYSLALANGGSKSDYAMARLSGNAAGRRGVTRDDIDTE